MSAFHSENKITNGVYQSKELCRWFSFVEIQLATNNFDDALVIGKGGFGKVYKGFIDGGATTIAIKRSNAESKQGATEFWTEIKTLSKLRHTHLMALIGYSDDCEEMILVYEYMANGTLADHLYKSSRKGNGNDIYHLTWEERLKICIGPAHGLDYLHTDTKQGVIHRDVKTTNILLDENWVAKISDFGLSKMVNTSHTRTHVSTDVKGTFGYLDLAYFLTRRLTKKSDVYAFGVVLFEVLCARPLVDTSVEEDQMGLALWVQNCIKKGTFDQIIDLSIRGQISPNCLKVFVEVANKCLHNYPKGRPTMSEVVESHKHGLASQVNIRISRKMKILTNLFLRTAHVVANGIDLGWRKWKNWGPRNGVSG
ncbi:receptor-like protein kinase FERONIA [Camellia sinensis]|nr:receptor-like protein kinase FERONIA [Camellia sinensis]